MPDDRVARKSLEEISSSLLKMFQSLYTATKTVLMYPPESPSVVRMVDNAFDAIVKLIPVGGSLDLSFMEGKLVVNAEMLDDAFQKRGIIKNVHELMKARRISSITFWSGLTKDELRKFLVVLGTKAPTAGSEEQPEIYHLLEEEEITHVEVDEQIYVAISKREKVVDVRAAVESEEDVALKTLKDEVFARFLAGETSMVDLSDDAIHDILSDPEKMVSMVQGVISSQGWDSEIGALPFRIDETTIILERVSGLITQVDDPLVRSKLTKEIGKITTQIETPQLMEMLLKSPETAETSELPRVLLPLIGDKKLAGVVESVVEEYESLMRQESGDEWPTPRMSALRAVLDQAAASAEGETATLLGDMIGRTGIDEARPEEIADVTGWEVARSLMGVGDVEIINRAKGPALVGAARFLFEKDQDELGARVMEKLAEKFRAQSSEARVVAAQQIWGLFKVLRDLGKEGFTADLVDDVSQTLDEREAARRTLSELTESMEAVAPGGPAGSTGGEKAAGLVPGMEMSGRTIEKLMKSDTGKVVQAAFRSGDKEAQEAITRVLMGMEDRAMPVLLDAAVASTSDETLESLAVSLEELDADPIPQIASRMSEELEEMEFVNLIKLTALVGEENSVSLFNHLLPSESLEIHMAIIHALGSLGGKQALQMVLSESVNVDPQMRVAAIRELGKFKDYQAVRRLMEVVAPRKKGEPPEEDSVLMNACHSLEKLNVRQAVPALVEIARGGKRHDTYTEEVRAYATSALGGIGGQDAQKALRKLLKDNSMLIRSSARKALGL
ncbi:MAG: hypothetical protein KKB90_00730 [Actinobacteria bacterium]|nr:hypothetical protein [Actinomycetota bacterium]